jgi:DNA polymerase III delta prime subunit
VPPKRRSTTRKAAAKPARTRGTRPQAITALSDSVSHYNWLIYGDTGVGKTTLAAELPRNLFVTFEVEGTESAKVAGSTADEIVIRTREEYLELYDYFDLGTGCDDYGWVTMDSVSEMEECFWRSQLRRMKMEKPSTRHLYKPALDDYPWVWNQVKAAIDEWNALPINVLYTAQVMPIEMYDDDTEEEYNQLVPMVGSAKNGILARKVAGMVSLLGYYDVLRQAEDDDDEADVEEFRRLYMVKRKSFLAKNRYGWPAHADNPSLPKMVAAADRAMASTQKNNRRTRAK